MTNTPVKRANQYSFQNHSVIFCVPGQKYPFFTPEKKTQRKCITFLLTGRLMSFVNSKIVEVEWMAGSNLLLLMVIDSYL